MVEFILLMSYIWMLLIDNIREFDLTLFQLGDFEVNTSLIIKGVIMVHILLRMATHKSTFKLGKIFYIFSIYLFLSTLSLLYFNPGYFVRALSVNVHIQIILYFIYYLTYSKLNEDKVKLIHNGFEFFVIVNTVLLYISYFFPESTHLFEAATRDEGYTRAFGIMGDQLPYVISYFVYYNLISNNWLKALFFIVGILMTASLNAFLILIALLVAYLISWKYVSRELKLAGLAISIIAIMLVVVKPEVVTEIGPVKRLMSSEGGVMEQDVIRLRFASYFVAFEMIKTAPLLGFGYGSYSFIVADFYEPLIRAAGEGWRFESIRSTISAAFNQFIQMQGETGLIGLFILIGLLRYFIVSLKSEVVNTDFSTRLKHSTRIWVFVFVITCLTANWLLPASFIWILMSVLIGLCFRLIHIKDLSERNIA